MDYDSARHHYESLQTAKKKDEAKIAKVRLAVVAPGERPWESLQGPQPPGSLFQCWLCRHVPAPWRAGILRLLCRGVHSR